MLFSDSGGCSWDNPIIGSNHAAELAAFFDGPEIFDPADQALVVAMRQYWTSFVTSGAPVAKGAPVWEVSSPPSLPV